MNRGERAIDQLEDEPSHELTLVQIQTRLHVSDGRAAIKDARKLLKEEGDRRFIQTKMKPQKYFWLFTKKLASYRLVERS